jgi:signal transduction histidine kinase
VRRAVQALGGSAWAQPVPQGGAQLCFKLPDAVVADAPPTPTLQSAAGALA